MGLVNTGASLGGLAGGANVARLMVVISGSSGGLSSALGSAMKDVRGFSARVQALKANSSAIGSQLIRGISLPAMAVGGAMIKMAMDYEAAMARVAGLTTLTTKQVTQAYDELLDMSTRVPTAPTELAESLYFAGSAGLKFRTAMKVVEASAQAAAIGMGSADDISKILIYSLNTFGDQGLKTARAMDVFTAAVKEGTAPPDELALALGRVLPVAKEVGVSFDTTVASIAALTNLGLPTRVAATSLRALFGGLLAPTKQATEALAEFGVTTEQLRDAVDAGPLVAFKLLEDAVGGNEDMMRKIIPQIRAFTAYLGLSGEQAKRTAEVYNEVRKSAGAFNKAVGKIETSRQFQFALAMNRLREAGIRMGTALFPIFDKLVAVLGQFGQALGGLGGFGSSVAAGLIAVAAAIGPLTKLYAVMSAQGAGMVTSLKAIGASAIVASAGWVILSGAMKDAEKNGITLGNALMIGASSFAAVGITLNLLVAGLVRLGAASFQATGALTLLTFRAVSAAEMIKATWLPLTLIFTAFAVGLAIFRSKAGETERQVKELSNAMVDLGADTLISKKLFNELSNSMGALELDIFKDAVRDAGVRGEVLGSSLKKITRALKDDIDRLRAVTSDTGDMGGDTSVIDLFRLEGLENQLAVVERARRTFKELAEDKIALYSREGAAYDRLADKYGVSSDFIRTKVSEVGVGVTELSGDTEKAWAEQVGFVDKSTGQIVAALNAQREAEQKIIEERTTSLRGETLGTFFEKDAEKIKASTAKLLERTTAQADAAVQMAENIGRLRVRGLDPGALQLLVDQGPVMVGKFVDATDAELKKFESNYYRSLGAVDAAILNEGKHQEIKGKGIVAQFSEGILSNRALPVHATSEIVGRVVDAFGRGEIGLSGVKFITKFADRMEAMKNLPKDAAQKILDEVIEVVKSGKFDDLGVAQINKLAEGMVSRAGVPKKAAGAIEADIIRILLGINSAGAGRKLIEGFTYGINAVEHKPIGALEKMIARAREILNSLDGYGAGFRVGSTFGMGINAAEHGIEQALGRLGPKAKTATEKAMQNSPEFFTYYMGQKLVNDMQRGIDSRNVRGVHRPDMGIIKGRTRGLRGGKGGGFQDNRNIMIHVHDAHNPNKVAREIKNILNDEQGDHAGRKRFQGRQYVG